MLTIQQKAALISQIRDILTDDSLTDDVKAQLITECLPSDLSRGVIIDLIETDGENASTESLLRQTITLNLPLCFEALYKSAGLAACTHRDNRYDFHSYQNLLGLMRSAPKFTIEGVGGYGPGGELTAHRISFDRACSWKQYLQEELDMETSVLKSMAVADMFKRGIRVAEGTPIDFDMVVDETSGKEKLVARPRPNR